MEPIPETTEAAKELDPMTAADDLLQQLIAVGARVRELVPQCVGMSVTMLQHGVTLTLVASDHEIAALDAMQYVDDGPCVAAVHERQLIATTPDTMDERGWQLFADATAARGVLSTLSMPLLEHGQVLGGVNLYGGSPDAFDGRHDELAEVLGAWAQGAVTNADLSFSTRETARQAPRLLRDATHLEVASGMLAARVGIGVQEARSRVDAAAQRADLPAGDVARLVVELLSASSA